MVWLSKITSLDDVPSITRMSVALSSGDVAFGQIAKVAVDRVNKRFVLYEIVAAQLGWHYEQVDAAAAIHGV